MKAALGFTREEMIARLEATDEWDVLVIGGGATGLGVAVDSALRGYKTALIEQSDFAKGTSSRSTKLVHGGVRYLAQGNIKLVYHALRERGLLLKNAPHLVKKQNFIIPVFSQFERLKYLVGLKMYDWLAGRLSFGSSRFLSKAEVAQQFPTLRTKGLIGGIEYFDGQFDDARLAINLAQTAAEESAVMLNYVRVEELTKTNGIVDGLKCRDMESGKTYQLKAKAVINATGVFVDDVLRLDEAGKAPMVSPSQGVHIVLKLSAMKSSAALMIPETRDGRVLFAIPWHEHLLIGTTDTPVDVHALEPRALEKEIAFILETVGQFIEPSPTRENILSTFAGLRPLAARTAEGQATKEISRDHKLVVSDSKLITITGGKWTTYREMAEDTINRAIIESGLTPRACTSATRKIHGHEIKDEINFYGSDLAAIKALEKSAPGLEERLVAGFSHTKAEVIWAVRHEMARRVEDVLSRRCRILLLDAKAALKAAPVVAELMAAELGRDESWIQKELEDFRSLVGKYLP
jgi:glycerol-3-phosphate dehydrogenase